VDFSSQTLENTLPLSTRGFQSAEDSSILALQSDETMNMERILGEMKDGAKEGCRRTWSFLADEVLHLPDLRKTVKCAQGIYM